MEILCNDLRLGIRGQLEARFNPQGGGGGTGGNILSLDLFLFSHSKMPTLVLLPISSSL